MIGGAALVDSYSDKRLCISRVYITKISCSGKMKQSSSGHDATDPPSEVIAARRFPFERPLIAVASVPSESLPADRPSLAAPARLAIPIRRCPARNSQSTSICMSQTIADGWRLGTG